MKKVNVSSEFKQLLCDRFTAAELAEFLDISTEEFCEMFEADIEYNYSDLCEALQYDTGEENEFEDEDYE